MALVRLTNVTRDALAGALASAGRDVPTFYFTHGDTATAMAALDLNAKIVCGVWFDTDAHVPATMLARDIKTLAALVRLRDVVFSGAQARAYYEAVSAMLSNDAITFSNDVATVVEMMNRPAPTHMPTLWIEDADRLRSATTSLRRRGWRKEHDVVRFD